MFSILFVVALLLVCAMVVRANVDPLKDSDVFITAYKIWTSMQIKQINRSYLMSATGNALSWQQLIPSPCSAIDPFHKSHNAPVLYPTMPHSEQKCAHICSELCTVAYGTGALLLFSYYKPMFPNCTPMH